MFRRGAPRLVLTFGNPRWPKHVTRINGVTPRHFYKPWMRGYYPEDWSNDYDMALYFHPKETKMWYARTEIRNAQYLVDDAGDEQSENFIAGKHYTGDGPFERELERKGIPVDKYPLPTTVKVRRIREMVLLRRKKLEEVAAKELHKAREAKKKPYPSAWYDEASGPLNKHFLHFMQKNYTVNVVDLPENPLRYSDFEAQCK